MTEERKNVLLTRAALPHILWLIAGVIGQILRIAIPIYLYVNGQREIALLIFISNILVYYADTHFHGK